MHRCGVATRHGQKAGTLSGGEQQMLAIGQARPQERAALTGRVLFEENQWVINEYDLVRQGGSWFVARNVVTRAPGPLPPPRPVPPSMPCILIYPPPPGCDTGQPALAG